MAGRPGPRKAPAVTAERRAQAFELRKAGVSLRQIATTLGVDHTTVARYVKHTIAGLKRQTLDLAAEERTLQLERLNKLLLTDWPAATAGVTPWSLAAQDRVFKILERQAKLLGLDLAPPPLVIDASTNIIQLVWSTGEPA